MILGVSLLQQWVRLLILRISKGCIDAEDLSVCSV